MVLSLLYDPPLTSVHDYWKNHSFDYTDLCWKMICLLFNTLFRFVIACLPRHKRLFISWLQSPFTVIMKTKKIKSVTASTFPCSICHDVMGQDGMLLVFLMLSSGQLFHFPFLPSSRDSLVTLTFLPLEWYHLPI